MDKRKEANIRVKNNITDALFTLMHEKSFSEISITEIIKKAKVARASYYRNYESKEDVLFTLIEDILADFKAKADYELTDYFSYHHALRCFQYFQYYKNYVLDLYQSGFASCLLEKLNQFHEINAGIMPASSLARYQLYMYIGALFNTAIIWLENDTKESAEDIARTFCLYIGIRPENGC